ncbi:hypothetical protein ACNOYE_03345 [Nannocystaceae bacterium ST9]
MSRSWTTLFAATLLGSSACSLLFDFEPCEIDEHCGAGLVCSAGACVEGMGGEEIEVGENIGEDTIWETGNTYRLTNVVHVENGATLTIRSGVRVIGEQGSALVVVRGARLESRGTEFEPVVFTSAQPEGERLPGDWGGVALLGRAEVNQANAVLEGLTDASRAGFGGTEDDWSCGVLEYTRIEFAGFALKLDEELNGLTLGGCGSGTIINHVQVHYGKDDGVEVFGGSVDLQNVVITRAQDDSLDWDRGWRGDAQFVAIQQDVEGDNGLECDNFKEDNEAAPRSAPRLYNVTLIGSGDPAGSQRGATFKEGTAGTIRNAIFLNHPVESIDVKGPSTVVQLQDETLSVRNSLFFAAGAAGDHFFPTPTEESADEDDDEGFDEATYFMASTQANTFAIDPQISSASDPAAPGWVPMATLTEIGVKPPGDGFFNEAATYPGAFAPGTAPWTENWTAYPEN